MYTLENAQSALLLPIARQRFGPIKKEVIISVHIILHSLKYQYRNLFFSLMEIFSINPLNNYVKTAAVTGKPSH